MPVIELYETVRQNDQARIALKNRRKQKSETTVREILLLDTISYRRAYL